MGADSFVRFNPLRLRGRAKTERLRMGPAIFHPQPLPRAENTIHFCSQLETENDASVVPEIALVIVAAGKAVPKPGEDVIKFRRPNGDGFAQWDIDSSPNDEIPCIVARSQGA